MTLKELIKLKQADWGMSRFEITAKIGVEYRYFSMILGGAKKMPERTLKNMLERLDFSGCENFRCPYWADLRTLKLLWMRLLERLPNFITRKGIRNGTNLQRPDL